MAISVTEDLSGLLMFSSDAWTTRRALPLSFERKSFFYSGSSFFLVGSFVY